MDREQDKKERIIKIIGFIHNYFKVKEEVKKEGEKKMINREKLRIICGNGIYNNIPVDNIESLDIRYYRVKVWDDKMFKEILASKGGATKVTLTINNTEFSGKAICSHSDNYCRKTGRKLALVRAFRNYWSSLK